MLSHVGPKDGLMRRRIASINDLPIKDGERKYNWPTDHSVSVRTITHHSAT